LSRLAAAALCATLSACGFQLRGEAPADLRSIHVTTAANSAVAVAIRRQLSGGPMRLAAEPGQARARIHILAENTEKSIQTLTSAGRVFDYVLRLRVDFEAADAAGHPLVERSGIEVRRIITYSETAPLAKEVEERQLFDDMRDEAAARILRRVAVAKEGALPR